MCVASYLESSVVLVLKGLMINLRAVALEIAKR